MNVKSVFIVIAAAVVGGCATSINTPGADIEHNARNALDWAGAYRGVLPCADCPGIETVIILNADGTYSMRWRYLERGDQIFTEEGRFTWDEAGGIVSLQARETTRYAVSENHLTQLALDGSRITGPIAENFVLTKSTNSLTETYWKLVELNGQPVPARTARASRIAEL